VVWGVGGDFVQGVFFVHITKQKIPLAFFPASPPPPLCLSFEMRMKTYEIRMNIHEIRIQTYETRTNIYKKYV